LHTQLHRRLYQVLVVFVCVCVCVYAHMCAAQGATIQSPTPALHTQCTDVCIKC
jgi:ribulose-5-phosphate 4-epimerase/fuculose-1-phosphate aldolase